MMPLSLPPLWLLSAVRIFLRLLDMVNIYIIYERHSHDGAKKKKDFVSFRTIDSHVHKIV